VGMQKVHF